jgi:hypothetical protein
VFDRRNLFLPPEWRWAASREDHTFREENCGILGGNNVEFIRYFATLAIDLIMDPAHQEAWAEFADHGRLNMLLEQFLLAACVDYHRISPASPFRGVSMRHLFPVWHDAFNADSAARAGFTHLLGDTKADPRLMSRLEKRLVQMDPAFVRHCENVARSAAVRGI